MNLSRTGSFFLLSKHRKLFTFRFFFYLLFQVMAAACLSKDLLTSLSLYKMQQPSFQPNAETQVECFSTGWLIALAVYKVLPLWDGEGGQWTGILCYFHLFIFIFVWSRMQWASQHHSAHSSTVCPNPFMKHITIIIWSVHYMSYIHRSGIYYKQYTTPVV